MTIKKQWIIVLLFISLITVLFSTLFLSMLTGKYFSGYMETRYTQHLNEIVDYVTKNLENCEEDSCSYLPEQMRLELSNHLDEPITGIYFVDYKNNVEISVGFDEGNSGHGHMSGHMNNDNPLVINSYKINSQGDELGLLKIQRMVSITSTSESRFFTKALVRNTIISSVVAVFLSMIIAVVVSKKTTSELYDTAEYANAIDLDKEIAIKSSNIVEINSIRRSLKDLRTKLKLKDASRKNLVDELVHQSRTPLTIIKNYLEAVEDGILNFGNEEIDICKNEIDNLTSIISNISQMIETSGERENTKIEDFELVSVISQIVKGLSNQFDSKNIQLTLSGDKSIKIKSDKYKISQAIYNILTNAYKFTQENGKVEIVAYKKKDSIILEISDNGIGIDKNEIEDIFSPYVTTRKNGNTGEGLGLYIVKKNLEDIGGDILVNSRVGEGSTFTITIDLENR